MKRFIATLCIVILLVTLLAGCGGDTESEQNGASEPTVSQGNTVSNNEGDSEIGTGFPLTDTPVTIEAWWPVAFSLTVIPNMEENLVFQTMEELTNIRYEFTTPSTGTESETFNILLASQEYPDLFSGFPLYYNKGLDFAIEDMLIQPIEDYLSVMPNISNLRDSREDMRKGMTTDKGHFAGIPFVRTDKDGDAQGAWVGGVIRQDWLDKLNLDTPRTYDQMEKVMTSFQDNGLADHPLWIRNDGFTLGNIVNGGFNVINNFYQVDGTVKYGPIEPSYQQYLEKLNDWYVKGFMATDFHSQQDYFGPIDKVANNEYAIFDAIYTWNTTYKMAAIDPDFKLSAIRSLVENESDEVHVRMSSDVAQTFLCISYDSEHTELICRYWDYLFSEEGILLSNYGVEGVTFEYDENGDPQWSGPLTSDAPEFNLSDTQGAYFLYNTAGYILYDREVSIVEPEAIEFVNIWNEDGYDYYYPGTVTMTSEENTTFANTMADINTFVTENVVKFIIGDQPFSEYGAFVEQIRTMGIDDAIAVKQTALDRYIQR